MAEIEPALRAGYPSEPDFNALAAGTPLHAIVNSAPILDIGANIGFSAVGFRRVGLTVPIHCFEPNPFLVGVLNRAAGQIGDIHIRQIGFADGPGRMLLYVPFVDGRPIHQEASLSREHFGAPFIENRLRSYGEDVQLVSVEAEITTIDALDFRTAFIKIDVEGAEGKVLRGAARTIDRCRPILHIENGALEETTQILTALDYDWFHFGKDAKLLTKSRNHYNRYWIPCEHIRDVATMIGRA